MVCRSLGPQASRIGRDRVGAGANALRRSSQARTASVAICSCTTSQWPTAHHTPICRMAGSSTSSMQAARPNVCRRIIESGADDGGIQSLGGAENLVDQLLCGSLPTQQPAHGLCRDTGLLASGDLVPHQP